MNIYEEMQRQMGFNQDGGTPPAQAPKNDNLSPEANSSVNGGRPLNDTPPPPDAPAPAAPKDGGAPPPAATQPQAQPRLPGGQSGRSNLDQANDLNGLANKYGVKLPPFAVGGTSPYDSAIIAQLNTINDPNSSPDQIKNSLNGIAGLIPLRNKSVNGEGVMMYDPTNAAASNYNRPRTAPESVNEYFQHGIGAENSAGISDLISKLKGGPDVSGIMGNINQLEVGVPADQMAKLQTLMDQSTAPSANSEQLNQLLSKLGSGMAPDERAMVMQAVNKNLNYQAPERDKLLHMIQQVSEAYNPEVLNGQEGRLAADLQTQAAQRRQEVADKLSGAGVYGGRAGAELGHIDYDTQNALSHGLVDLRSSFADKNANARRAALEQLMNLSQTEGAQGIAASNSGLSALENLGGLEQSGQKAAVSGMQTQNAQDQANRNSVMQVLQQIAQLNQQGKEAGLQGRTNLEALKTNDLSTALKGLLDKSAMETGVYHDSALMGTNLQQLSDSYNLGTRGQDLNALMTLINLAQSGDESAAQRIMQMFGITQGNDGGVK